jgi:hypothetical protein
VNCYQTENQKDTMLNQKQICSNMKSFLQSWLQAQELLILESQNKAHGLYTNFLELSPSWEATSCAATQELPNILWNPKVHHCVHKSPPLVPILRQINPVHTTPSYLRSILILSTHLCLGLPRSLFPSGILTNILYAFLSATIHANALPISSS